jgi:hypothetical protein
VVELARFGHFVAFFNSSPATLSNFFNISATMSKKTSPLLNHNVLKKRTFILMYGALALFFIDPKHQKTCKRA